MSLEGAENRNNKLFECHDCFVWKKTGNGTSLNRKRARFTAKWVHFGVVRYLQIRLWR
jgi:hypothetical protein